MAGNVKTANAGETPALRANPRRAAVFAKALRVGI
jgi:hypothetical protein